LSWSLGGWYKQEERDLGGEHNGSGDGSGSWASQWEHAGFGPVVQIDEGRIQAHLDTTSVSVFERQLTESEGKCEAFFAHGTIRPRI
jgi:hypothetical protein